MAFARSTGKGRQISRWYRPLASELDAKIAMFDSGQTAKPPGVPDTDGFALSPKAMPGIRNVYGIARGVEPQP
jgi:hypothetical protein